MHITFRHRNRAVHLRGVAKYLEDAGEQIWLASQLRGIATEIEKEATALKNLRAKLQELGL